MESWHALALGFSFLAVVISAGVFFRGTPAQVRSASAAAQVAISRADAALESQAAFKIECQRILEAVADEREEASRLRARASAAASRADRQAANSERPMSREEILAQLRSSSGLV